MPYVHFFSAFATHLQAFIAQGGYVLLLIFTVLEGLPVIGMAVPGHVSVILAGFLARIGTLDLTWVLTISLVGAVLGDYLGFFLGRKYGITFIDRLRPYFFVTDAHIEKARGLLATHTGKAMIIGRFTPATRGLLPFLVGTTHTKASKFWLFNIIGAALWVFSSVAIGYIFGSGYHLAASYVGRTLVVAILAAIVIVWGYRFVNMRFHIFKRYELFTLALNILSLWALAEAIEDAFAKKSFMAGFDVWVNALMDKLNHASSSIVTLAKIVTTLGGTAVTIGLGILLGLWFLLRKKWRSASIALLGIGSAALMTGLLKEFFLRERPMNALQVLVNDPSFPSGHATMAAAFFVIFAYLFAPKIHSWIKREVMIVLCVLTIIAIGLSRLVLNVHWASDVIAGWSLGVFCATASILLVRYLGALLVRKG